jgi:nucleotide-binding universal stress UspA family protein
MKTLLVATDFTAASHNAFLYSLQLAQSLEAKIILFHAFLPITLTGLETSIETITTQELEVSARDRLQQHLRSAGAAINIPVELHCAAGASATAILEEAGKIKADLIVTGMKTHGKTFRKLFGSTVTALTQHSTIPLLVVPEETSYKQPQRIALANDILPEAGTATLDMLATIGQGFHSTVLIVRIISDRFEEIFELRRPKKKYAQLSRTLDTQYEYYRSKHITGTLYDFIHEQHIDMMAFIPHQHSLLDKLFYKSQTKSMLFKSDIPLLILPEQKATTEPAAKESIRLSI